MVSRARWIELNWIELNWIVVRRGYRNRLGSPTVSIGMFAPYLLHYALQKTVFGPPNRFSDSRLSHVFLAGRLRGHRITRSGYHSQVSPPLQIPQFLSIGIAFPNFDFHASDSFEVKQAAMVAPTASKRASVCTSPLVIRIIKGQPQTANKVNKTCAYFVPSHTTLLHHTAASLFHSLATFFHMKLTYYR
jgi:hypothetical protein